jgi:hydrogenase expression/formation protein HypE
MSPKDEYITLAHGGGGTRSWELINEVIIPSLGAEGISLEDSANLGGISGELALTSDSFVVTPRFFPGGDLGRLAAIGTANDLAVAGAKPLFLTLSLIIEEGFAVAELRQLLSSTGQACREVGCSVVAGDTKVVPHGGADGLFLNTSGVGHVAITPAPSVSRLVPGDELVVSGDIGRHEAAVMLARGAFGISGTLESDLGYIGDGVFALSASGVTIHFARDLTRGGLAMALYEAAVSSGVGILLREKEIPVLPQVQGLCSLLGTEPWNMAGEGTFVAAVASGEGEKAKGILRSVGFARAEVIGVVKSAYPGAKLGQVRMTTQIGTERIVPPPLGETNPRIC